MGKQVQIVSIGEDHTVQLNTEELGKILLAPKVKDKAVAVVSIIGAFRTGKSFLMNFLLRYLSNPDKSKWMEDEDTPVQGFSWSTSSERHTQGILLWDEVFLVPTSTGDELAVVLMDTQGAFDSESSADEATNLFAISILTSSLQIFNISRNLQEDNLEHLQLVTEYGKLAQEDTEETMFQKLAFLIRDWQFPDKAYGATGGRQLLEKFMSTSTKDQDKNSIRQCLSSCFSSIECFLMPHLGKETTRESFDGRLCKLDDDFKRELGVLVPWLVGAENLTAKEIAGKRITCEHLMNYFKVYTDVFKEQQPRVATILQATVEESNRSAKEEAKAFYAEQLPKVTYKNFQELEENHVILQEEAKKLFRDARKIGGPIIERRYLDVLEMEIRTIFKDFSYDHKLSDLREKERGLNEKNQALEKKEKELGSLKEQLRKKSRGVLEKEKKLQEEAQNLSRQKMEHEKSKKAQEKSNRWTTHVADAVMGIGVALSVFVPAAGVLDGIVPVIRIGVAAAAAGTAGGCFVALKKKLGQWFG
ncbi:atlastin-1 [Rhipicephalus microplus]|uniref:atlastin-1 n=1 Tax=Rhipicephalus microplus TaxID=6941 RepID=UPI003F6CF8C1